MLDLVKNHVFVCVGCGWGAEADRSLTAGFMFSLLSKCRQARHRTVNCITADVWFLQFMWIITTNKHHAREGVPSNLHVGWSGSSTGAGAAVWEGTRLSGGAEDASAAAAGGAEAGADLQAHSSQRRGKITQNSLRNTSGPNIVVGCAHQWWISFCCFCVISQFAPVCESTLHEKQPLHSKFVSSLIISDSNAK